MKKRILAILCCAVMVFGLGACGGTDSGSNDRKDDTEATETEMEENDAWKDAYKEVIAGVIAEEGTYAFDQEEYGKAEDYAYLEELGEESIYQYEIYDVDVDGTPELFVKFYRGSDSYSPIRVFAYENGKVKEFEKEFDEGLAYGVKVSEQYKGIMSYSFGRMNGTSYYTIYEVVAGEITKVASAEYTYDQTQDPKYEQAWSWVEWTNADDLSTLELYETNIEQKVSIVESEDEEE